MLAPVFPDLLSLLSDRQGDFSGTFGMTRLDTNPQRGAFLPPVRKISPVSVPGLSLPGEAAPGAFCPLVFFEIMEPDKTFGMAGDRLELRKAANRVDLEVIITDR